MKTKIWISTFALLPLLVAVKVADNNKVCTVNTIINGRVTIVCFRQGDSVYLLRDMSRGHGIITLHADQDGNEDFCSHTADWKLDSINRGALDVHYCVSKTFDFYEEVFHRNSLDGFGCAIYSYVNDHAIKDNAIWANRQLRVGINSQTGRTVVSLDIVGHELTHGVIATTCRLAAEGEPGAINESICDIMGKSLEFWVRGKSDEWVIGSEAGLHFRDMADPRRFKHPVNYNDSTYWYNGIETKVAAHVNSTVGSHMFYLLVHGGTSQWAGHIYDVKAISLAEADQIIYFSFVKYLFPRSTYKDWRAACLASASDLFGKNSQQYRSTAVAWSAVGIEEK